MIAFWLLAACGTQTPEPTPAADDPAHPPVTETYHGVEVTEHHRWLEDADDPEVLAWVKAQDEAAQRALESLPVREPLRAELAAILGATEPTWFDLQARGQRLFALKKQPPSQHPLLVVLPSADAPTEERVLLDPGRFDPEGRTAIDWYEASHDGALVAVSLSRDGTEAGDVHVFDVATGTPTGTVVPRVNGGTAGGWLAWDPDGQGFHYSRYPREGERPPEEMAFWVTLWHHDLQTGEDTFVLGEDFPRIAEVRVDTHPTGAVLVTVQKGDGGEFEHHLKPAGGDWTQLSTFDDQVQQVVLSEDGGHLYLVSFDEAERGRILRAPMADPSAREVFVPEGEDTVVAGFWEDTLVEHGGHLYAVYQEGGPSELRAFTLEGEPAPAPEQPEIGRVDGFAALPGGDLLLGTTTFLTPLTWSHFDADAGETRKTSLSSSPTVDLSGVTVERAFATSADGTRVPYSLVVPRGAEAPYPVIVTGYGGYGVSKEPYYLARVQPILRRGVGYAVANLRGGGEYGETWHAQGSLVHKQNVFDDLHAVLGHLVQTGRTSHDRLGLIGGSNGGLLMGAILTQHPDDAAVVVSEVGIYDMLRVETTPNGAFNVTEFGTVKDPEQFAALHAYSPYHHVEETEYPPTLLTAGLNDPRVEAWHSWKMAARLQEAQQGEAPILVRTYLDRGHGMGTPLDARIEEEAETGAFLLHHLGIRE